MLLLSATFPRKQVAYNEYMALPQGLKLKQRSDEQLCPVQPFLEIQTSVTPRGAKAIDFAARAAAYARNAPSHQELRNARLKETVRY